MSPEIARKVFDPFFTTKEGGRCAGLGLSIAFGIVRAHRGRIDVRSAPGQGSTFSIVLPAASALAEAAEGEQEQSDEDARAQGQLPGVMVGQMLTRVIAPITLLVA